MMFKELAVGDTFRFESENTMPHSGMKTGPWVKLSEQRYVHAEDGMKCRVGTIKVAVQKLNSSKGE